MHQFIARCHGNDARVRAFAAALSIVAIYGLIACVMMACDRAASDVPRRRRACGYISVAIVLIVAAATLPAGRFGILYATQIQLGLVYLGLFAATVLLLYLQGSAIGAMRARALSRSS